MYDTEVLSCADLDSPYSVHKAHAGEGEQYLREAFSEAYLQAARGKPALIFIDELDAICPRRNDR
jgi:ATP-dependent 26S proteasome regulatory subunit